MSTLTLTMPDGVAIVADAWGDPENQLVLLSHGGGQTRHAWGGTAKAIADNGWYAVAYDHRGHGDSDWSADGDYGIDVFARDQVEIVEQLQQTPVLVGASLGGMSAMYAQGNRQDPVYRALILVDVTPNIRQEGALRILDFMTAHIHQGFSTLEEAANAIAAYSHRPSRQSSGLQKNLRKRKDGRYYWHWDPNLVREMAEKGGLDRVKSGEMMGLARNLQLPILLVRGSESDVVTEEVAAEFVSQFPHADCVTVEKARHMVAGDRNDIFTQSVLEFLERLLW